MPSNDGKKTLMGGYTMISTINNYIKEIKDIEEKGSFAPKEQTQFVSLMKAVKENGGFDKLSYDALRELVHIVKVLGGNGDKSTMIKGEATDFIANISQKGINR